MSYLVLPLVVGSLGGCSVSPAGEGTASSPYPSPVVTSTNNVPTVKYMAVAEIDERAYLDGLARREPERAAMITEEQALQLGKDGCGMLVSEQQEGRVARVEEMIEGRLIGFGLTDKDAHYLAPDILNAASGGAICEPDF